MLRKVDKILSKPLEWGKVAFSKKPNTVPEMQKIMQVSA